MRKYDAERRWQTRATMPRLGWDEGGAPVAPNGDWVLELPPKALVLVEPPRASKGEEVSVIFAKHCARLPARRFVRNIISSGSCKSDAEIK